MRRIITTALCSLIGLNSISQVAFEPGEWGTSIGTREITIYNPEEVELETSITITLDEKKYVLTTVLPAQDHASYKFPEDFGITNQDMPEMSGVASMLLQVEAGGQFVYEDYVFLSARNERQPFQTDISEIEDRINVYGDVVDDCIYWLDHKGYNYVIRSHNENRSGIFLSHWVMNINGDTERFGYYKSREDCGSENTRIQRHSIGFSLEDSDNDGYMEFYTLLIDDCTTDINQPLNAVLKVFTNYQDLELKGKTYNLSETGEIGGDYSPSKELIGHSEILESAKDAWEVFIIE